ncbi:MAG: hypothetical protein IIC80_07395 [Chloroflexi bacterium]|nr:hypothetical protein [Chloroflexota bacterium]
MQQQNVVEGKFEVVRYAIQQPHRDCLVVDILDQVYFRSQPLQGHCPALGGLG